MNIDKFGHHVFKRQINVEHYEPPIAVTIDGCLDARNKAIKNIGKPSGPADCATKQYVDKNIENIFNKLKSINQSLTQVETEINSLKQNIDSVAQKNRKK